MLIDANIFAYDVVVQSNVLLMCKNYYFASTNESTALVFQPMRARLRIYEEY